jgi:hypothetical protein
VEHVDLYGGRIFIRGRDAGVDPGLTSAARGDDRTVDRFGPDRLAAREGDSLIELGRFIGPGRPRRHEQCGQERKRGETCGGNVHLRMITGDSAGVN